MAVSIFFGGMGPLVQTGNRLSRGKLRNLEIWKIGKLKLTALPHQFITICLIHADVEADGEQNSGGVFGHQHDQHADDAVLWKWTKTANGFGANQPFAQIALLGCHKTLPRNRKTIHRECDNSVAREPLDDGKYATW